MRRRARPVLAAVLAGLLAGCAVGPDFQRPATAAATAYTAAPLPPSTAAADGPGGGAQRFAADQDIGAQWWTAFHNAALDALVHEAFDANPDVQAAQAALHQANDLLAAQRGSYFPQLQAGVAPTRQKNAVGTLAPTLASGAPIYNLYTAQLSVGYVLDAFGGNRRAVESLAAQAEAQRFALEATYLTLSTNVVLAAVQEASLRAQIAAVERVVAIAQEQLRLQRRAVELGAIAAADASAQEVLVAQSRAQLPGLRRQLAVQRDALSALLGRLPAREPDQTFTFDTLELPAELPLSLPSSLVEHRPDVRAAEAQLHAASAQVGVATASMLPQITLSGSLGGTATTVGTMFAAGNTFWSAGASLSQTLFAGGALLQRRRAAIDALDQAGAQYRATVIAAFQNVADTLQALVFDAQALQASAEAQQAAERSLGYTRSAQSLGAVSDLALLGAEQAYQQAVLARVQAQAARYADTAALFQALGGGWWNGPSPGTSSGATTR